MQNVILVVTWHPVEGGHFEWIIESLANGERNTQNKTEKRMTTFVANGHLFGCPWNLATGKLGFFKATYGTFFTHLDLEGL